MLTFSDESYMFAQYAQRVSSKKYFCDTQWATEIYKEILYKQPSVIDVIRISNSIKDKNGLDDKKWANKILKNPYKYL